MLFEQIQSNKRKSIFVIIGFIFFVLLVGAAAGYYALKTPIIGMVISFIFMLFYVPITLGRSIKIVMKMNHAEKISSSRQAPHLWHTVENLSMVARIKTPDIYIIKEDSPNAFATGLTPDKAAVAVTTALLKKLNREEIEAVIAHEISHIKNYDMRLITISLALVSVIAIISDFGLRFLSGRKGGNPILLILSLILLIIAPIVSYCIHFSLSRNREFLADASGAELCRNPLALASALEKISKDDDPVDNIPPSAAAMYFSEPFKKKAKKKKELFSPGSWFNTHPPVEERIYRLKNM